MSDIRQEVTGSQNVQIAQAGSVTITNVFSSTYPNGERVAGVPRGRVRGGCFCLILVSWTGSRRLGRMCRWRSTRCCRQVICRLICGISQIGM